MKIKVDYYVLPSDPLTDGTVIMGGYLVGSAEYNLFSKAKTDITKAFGKTLPNSQKLGVTVHYNTDNLGRCSANLNSANYSDALTEIETSITAEKVTLQDLLA